MHIEPNPDAIRHLLAKGAERPVTMLNLLRFRDVADYSRSPELHPDGDRSGEAAYRRYSEAVMPLLEHVGATVSYLGAGGETVIGPTDEAWDLVLLVSYPSVAAFLSMTTSDDYRKIAGHRTAALSDSRLVPTTPAPTPST